MENKTNQDLIALLQEQRNIFMSFALRKCRNQEIAEDLIQSTLCKLLRLPIAVEVLNPKQFLFSTITRMYLNYRSVNKKYTLIGDVGGIHENIIMDHLMQNKFGCTFEDDLMDSFKLKEIRNAAKTLPSLQRESIHATLAGRDIAEDIGGSKKYNTLKANRRHAILKLREKFKQED